jgi:hypothetical protein
MMNVSNDVAKPRSGLAIEPLAGAIELLEREKYGEAVTLLEELARSGASPAVEGLLGTAYYLCERYEDAVKHLRIAVEQEPLNAEWQTKLALALANATSHAESDYPPVEAFDRLELLAAPRLEPNAIPASANTSRRPASADRARAIAEQALGAVSSALGKSAARVAAALGPYDAVWTTWYRKPLALGVATLSYMRDRLNERNLVDPYPPGSLTAFQSRGITPPSGVRHFRTPDGTWNNLGNPKEGAAGVRFPRNVSATSGWPQTGRALLTPNPAEVSHVLLSRGPDGIKEVPFLNLLAACWIQFMVHDWVSHRIGPAGGVIEVPLPDDHPARVLFRQSKLYVRRTAPDPTRSTKDAGLPATFINEVTSWWDASQIYGSDHATATSLRSFAEGKLTVDARGHLPLGRGNIEHTGYNRNWWLGLGLMHTLFVREHNAICDMLRKRYPAWDDTRLYNVARLVNAAVMAKIHTVEWTPAILPNRGLYLAMNANWYGFNELALHPDADHRKTRRAFKVRDPALGGLVGNAIDKHGKPYGMSEEFTEVYRLHELLPDDIVIRSRADGRLLESLPLAATRQAAVHEITDRIELENLFYSFGNQHPGQLVLNNFPRTLQRLSLPGNPVYDMGAVDILRARERGVPRYNEFRRQLGLKSIRSFEDLTTEPAQLAALKQVYMNDVELIDMHVGSRAESTRPTGFGFGETLFQVFILNASRRLQADRFFTENYDAETYTQEGLRWVDDATMKRVILRHFPELSATGLGNVNNAFEPWDTGALDPARHPLRAFS